MEEERVSICSESGAVTFPLLCDGAERMVVDRSRNPSDSRSAGEKPGTDSRKSSKMDQENRPEAILVHNEVHPESDKETHNPGFARSLSTRERRVTLEWKSVNVFVPIPKPSICKRLCGSRDDAPAPQIRQVLFDVSGRAEPGTLLAVMGASGAGKSTLMNVLAYRNLGSIQVTGEVKVNNNNLGLAINSISAYIQQEDLFIGTLTVREHLTFHALLRMDKKHSKQERLDRVEEAINELGLTKCADTVIGTPGRVRGISGGEKKRLSFASELLTDPAILFADEPTSGLDSFMAQSVVATLQRLAKQGRTIICTIHQPSSEVYTMFSSILLMAEGRTAYLGPAEGAIPYFAKFGHICPANFNPADYFVNTLAIVPGEEEECRLRIKEICDEYASKTERGDKENSHHRRDSFSDETVISRSPYKASWCKQFSAVLWRSWLSTRREAMLFQIRLMQSIITGLIAGLIYFQTPLNTTGVQNMSGAIFFLVTGVSFSSLQAVIFVFPAELPVFIRDHKNGMYRTDVYFLSKTLAELPVFLLSPLLLSAIAYWMIGLREDVFKFLICYAILVLLTNVAVSYGYIISSMVSTVEGASALGPPLMLPLLLFGGFFLKNTSVPEYFVWIKYISWFKYGFELLNLNQWDGFGKIGDGCQMPPFMNRTFSARPNATGRELCIPDGNAAIEFLDLDKGNFMIDLYALIALFVGFRILAFILLLRRSSKKQ
ncbi:protein white isoform X2 [Nematostella vectensis]|uniref:protein white isoform X2 n=1 Tax=Nematostella vectensis TaxID=45351 RepID=UPI0020773BB2|nr:protein white isoform X2 [Nematostella vectensis]